MLRFTLIQNLSDMFRVKVTICFYLPPYSVMLNPVEECQTKVKLKYCHGRLSPVETIPGRGTEATKQIIFRDLIRWVKHTIDIFQEFQNRAANL